MTEDSVYYGDFWYPGGAALADEFLSGRRKLPQAVVSASDHMAIGLVNRLAEGVVKIPEQVMVTGYDATQEAQINPIPVTTFDSNDEYIAMEAVNRLRSMMEPGAEILPYSVKKLLIHTGLTCPCKMEVGSFIGRFRDSLYYLNRDYGSTGLIGSMDIGALLEGYVSERLSGSRSVEECFLAVYSSKYTSVQAVLAVPVSRLADQRGDTARIPAGNGHGGLYYSKGAHWILQALRGGALRQPRTYPGDRRR